MPIIEIIAGASIAGLGARILLAKKKAQDDLDDKYIQ